MKSLIFFFLFMFVSVFGLFAFEPHFMEDPAISPDGKEICFSYLSDLWKVSVNGGEAKRLTSSEGKDFNPVYSPNGEMIAFNSTRDGWLCIYIIPAKGGLAEPISKEGLKLLDWFPDGKNLLATAGEPGFRNKFFKVNLNGSFEEITAFGGKYASVSQNGEKIIFSHWGKPTREAYRGSGNGEIYEYDIKSKKYGRLTRTDFTERYPVYSFQNKEIIYFAASDGKVFQLYKAVNSDFKNRIQLTRFKTWSVRDISIARQKDLLVFEKFDELWKYDAATEKAEKIAVDILEDELGSFVEKEKVMNKANRFAVSSNGKLAVFSYKYDLFAVPEKGGDVRQITHSQTGINDIVVMKDNNTIFFTTYEKGKPKLFKTEIKNLDKIDKVKWSEDKYINDIYESGNRLIVNFSDERRRKQIAVSDTLYEDFETVVDSQFVWQNFAISEDGRYALYSELREQLWSNHLFLYDFQAKKKHLLHNYDGFIGYIFWGKDGKSAFFTEGDKIRRLDLSAKKDFYTEKDNWQPILQPEKKENKKQKNSRKKNETHIDLEGIEKRIVSIISKPGSNKICYVLNDSTLYYLNNFEGKTELRKTDYFAENDESVYKFSGKINKISYNEKNGVFYFIENNTLKKLNPKSKKVSTVKAKFKYEYDKLKLNKDIFVQVWEKFGREFYDPNMHGIDWQKSFQRFYQFTDYAYTTDILKIIIDEMIGEVNASHTRFTPRKDKNSKSYQQAFGGFTLDFKNYPARGIRFKDIYKDSKLFKPYEIKSGDVLISVDGIETGKGKPINSLFMDKIGEKIKLEILSGDSVKTVEIKGLKSWQNNTMYYDDWVEKRRQIVSELSDGKIGYVHIRWMSDRSFDKFWQDFYADNYNKDALVLDVRNNGGGHTHDKILEVLTKRSYALVSRRYFDTVKHKVPHEAWEKPIILLINENSFSDAEIFPRLFKQFHLGKVVGMPTSGSVIGTNPYTLMDGSKMRLPQNGWYELDGTNMEGNGFQPDIFVEPTPEQIIADDDIQL
ncbi:MAG: DNA primase, partial [Candidatus Cloacimonadota bacterium]